MSNNKTGRIEYLDTARAWLISLVVLGHVLIVLNPSYDRLILSAVQEFMASFYMPAFFIIHGILLGNKRNTNTLPRRTMLARRARTLLVPYLFFEVLGMVCRGALYGQPFSTGVYNLLTIRCNVGADWFLPAMFMGSLLCTEFGIRQKRPIQLLSVWAAVALAALLPEGQVWVILGRGLLGYGFIMIGYLGRSVFVREEIPALWKMAGAFLVTAVCSLINLKWGGNDF